MGAQQGCCCEAEDSNNQALVPISKSSDKYGHVGMDEAEGGFNPVGDKSKGVVPALKLPGQGAGHNGRAGAVFIRLDRTMEVNIGLNLDALDDQTCFVDGILAGAVDTWNRNHMDQPTLKSHDRIIAVNGVCGETDALLKEMRHTTVWELVVDRPVEVKLRVDCQKYPSLGLDLKYSPNGGTLLIAGIADGAIKDWNANTTGAKIEPRDRIVEVNNIRGTARHLLDTATDVQELSLTVLHYLSNAAYSP